MKILSYAWKLSKLQVKCLLKFILWFFHVVAQVWYAARQLGRRRVTVSKLCPAGTSLCIWTKNNYFHGVYSCCVLSHGMLQTHQLCSRPSRTCLPQGYFAIRMLWVRAMTVLMYDFTHFPSVEIFLFLQRLLTFDFVHSIDWSMLCCCCETWGVSWQPGRLATMSHAHCVIVWFSYFGLIYNVVRMGVWESNSVVQLCKVWHRLRHAQCFIKIILSYL